ncbi:MAG TPA: Stk1 family PASTA domain-containing Ser/Thr kinase [Actinomycetota bacterium]|nr:Stk1 family PASTA domain-containing Ser/Thr kinase [Actinomycetota bacterium]
MTQQRRRVLGDRYEIDGVLGQGGMAKVFRGTDRVLGRTVAVKVLSPQFADDQGFVARFRREAQAAAALNHPNIVGVFDTGSQQDVHFIVMEYVEGKTLRDVLREDGPLLPERAVEVADAVARALESAHEAGLVHRDIKPGNIMLTSDGEVKVMDFGIARTTTGDTLTQTAAVLGTASYLSPEQAQGESVDRRSDIYSLGCVLYEMVTGRPPFTGDSPVAIAYKHVRDDPTLPSHVNGDIPPDLEAVVMKCLAKNPDNRYATARELREDLGRMLQGVPTLATPVMAGDATEMMTRRHEGTAVMTGVEAPPEEERRRAWVPIVLTLLILAALGIAAFFLVRSLLGDPVQLVTVPDVVGERLREAEDRLERAGFQVEVERRFNPAPRGEVLEQDPPAGRRVREGSTVTLTVSRGPRPEAVPEVVGLSQEEATAVLQEAGFEVAVQEQESEEEAGIVIDQEPDAGVEAEPGSTVTIVVSTGPPTTVVPDVICDPIPEAQAEIRDAGLVPQEVGSEFSLECPEGTVASQDPGAGAEVPQGSTVEYVRSEGPEPSPSPTPTLTPTP